MRRLVTGSTSVILIGLSSLSLSSAGLVFGATSATHTFPAGTVTLVSETTHDQQQQYRNEVKKEMNRARDLLEDLKKRVDAATSQEGQEQLKARIMTLNQQLERSERFLKNLDVIDPEPWLRSKTEMNAALADLEAAYAEAVPLLQDRTRSLQEALHHAKIATSFGEEGRKDLFLKNAQLAKRYAILAQAQGLTSEFMKEGISELQDAIAHINKDQLQAAATLSRGAYLHLNTVFKEQTES